MSRGLNILTWNCCAGFGRKTPLLEQFPWDVAVIQECSQVDAGAYAAEGGYRHVWDGNGRKGVGVFVRHDDVALDPAYAGEPSVILPVHVRRAEGNFRILAVGPKAAAKGIPAYVGRSHLALDQYRDFLDARDLLVEMPCRHDSLALHRALVRSLGHDEQGWPRPPGNPGRFRLPPEKQHPKIGR